MTPADKNMVAYKVYTYTDCKMYECLDIEMNDVGVWMNPHDCTDKRIFVPYNSIESIYHYAHSYYKETK